MISGIRSLTNACITIFYPIISTTIYAFAGLKLIIFIDLATFIFAVLTLIFLVKIPKKYIIQGIIQIYYSNVRLA